jgi:hypothetical protein
MRLVPTTSMARGRPMSCTKLARSVRGIPGGMMPAACSAVRGIWARMSHRGWRRKWVGDGGQQGGGGALSRVRRDLGDDESLGVARMCRWCRAARRRHSGREDAVGHRGGVERGVPRPWRVKTTQSRRKSVPQEASEVGTRSR